MKDNVLVVPLLTRNLIFHERCTLGDTWHRGGTSVLVCYRARVLASFHLDFEPSYVS